MPEQKASNYYTQLGLVPSASTQQIRRAYRELSKLYHPDTTTLDPAIATEKFQQLNEAYATLSSPERRLAYDLKIGYSRISVIQAPVDLDRPVSASRKFRSAYLDPSDRPLSAGELFAVFLLGLTFLACLALVIAIGLTRGETAFRSLAQPFAEHRIMPPADLKTDLNIEPKTEQPKTEQLEAEQLETEQPAMPLPEVEAVPQSEDQLEIQPEAQPKSAVLPPEDIVAPISAAIESPS
jgi:DnaJ domain